MALDRSRQGRPLARDRRGSFGREPAPSELALPLTLLFQQVLHLVGIAKRQSSYRSTILTTKVDLVAVLVLEREVDIHAVPGRTLWQLLLQLVQCLANSRDV